MAYFPETTFLPEILPLMKESILRLSEYSLSIGKDEMTISEVAESDWAAAWKEYYYLVRVTRFLTIVPSWKAYHAQGRTEKIITSDPDMALGIGTHPTTRLTLQALKTILRGGETVLDVGAGSGVLNITSHYLEAKDVYVYDPDEVATVAAEENMDLNPIAVDAHVSANDLLKRIDRFADIIIADISVDTTALMIEGAWRLLKQDGTFIISGIIEDKKAMVLEALAKVGFVVDRFFNRGDWYVIILEKPKEE